jgi:DNA-binding XRE family transcriptional regulator
VKTREEMAKSLGINIRTLQKWGTGAENEVFEADGGADT